MTGTRQTSTGERATAPRRGTAPARSGDVAVPAVTRGVAILKLLSRSPEPLGVIAIARALGIIPSTALHILRALVAEQLVSFDAETKRYALDAGILALARSTLRQDAFSAVAQPHLDAIAGNYGVTAIGTRVLGLEHMIVVAISHSQLMLRLHVDIGSRFPALISATGRCLAAFGGWPDADLERAFDRLRWDDPPDYARWKREVEIARQLGYGVDDGNYIRGITVLAAPVFAFDGRMNHALAVVAVRDQAGEGRVAAIGCDMTAAAAAISARLGYAPARDSDQEPAPQREIRNEDGKGNAGKRKPRPT